MSKLSKKPIAIPDGVTVSIKDGRCEVKGPKGSLTRKLTDGVTVSVTGKEAKVVRSGGSRQARISEGTTFAHLKNMLHGVKDGFMKTLLLEGVGYRAQAQKNVVNLALGFSHPVKYHVRDGVKVETPEPTRIIVSGADIEAVGQVSAEIRRYKLPEPYKGKGIRYENEIIRRKAGKAAAK